MNSLHYHPRDGPMGMMRLPSPTELPRFGPFGPPPPPPPPPPPSHHSLRGSQTCPVHGHDTEQHVSRVNGLSFDPLSHLPRDFHGDHSLLPRTRDETMFIRERHGYERKEVVNPHAGFEEDLWRRSVDYRWPGLPPHLLDEQYRRYILSMAGYEHSLKESPHCLPQFYYGQDYSLPVDAFMPPSIVGQGDVHRHFPPVSPRLLDYYRQGEHNSVHRGRTEFERRDLLDRFEQREIERKQDVERKEKALREGMPRTPSVESVKKRIDGLTAERSKHNSSSKIDQLSKPEPPTTPQTPQMPQTPHKMPIFKGIDFNNRKSSPPKAELSTKPNSICNLISSKLDGNSTTTEYAAASILASMNRLNQSPSLDEEVHSVNEARPLTNAALPLSAQVKTGEDTEKKLAFLSSLGLVPHLTRQALEEDFERKRWERKLRKFKGRPKKRPRRENSEEVSKECDNNNRPGSELDFYTGPMTRKKQQLLQEQENLLEQIQKNKGCTSSSDSFESDNSSNGDREERLRCGDTAIFRFPVSDKGDSGLGLDDVSETKQSGNLLSGKLSSDDVTRTMRNGLCAPNGVGMSGAEHSRLVAMLLDNNHRSSEQLAAARQVSPTGRAHLGLSLQQAKVSPDPGRSLSSADVANHPDDSDDIKALDCSVFGRCGDSKMESATPWPGLEAVALSYVVYKQAHESKCHRLKRKRDDFERQNKSLIQQLEQLGKHIDVMNDRLRIAAEQKRTVYERIEQAHQTMRTLQNL